MLHQQERNSLASKQGGPIPIGSIWGLISRGLHISIKEPRGCAGQISKGHQQTEADSAYRLLKMLGGKLLMDQMVVASVPVVVTKFSFAPGQDNEETGRLITFHPGRTGRLHLILRAPKLFSNTKQAPAFCVLRVTDQEGTMTTNNDSILPEEMEKIFGRIQFGWRHPFLNRDNSGIQVVSFSGGEYPPVISTLGLSNYPFIIGTCRKIARSEILCLQSENDNTQAANLFLISDKILQNNCMIQNGEYAKVSNNESDHIYAEYMTSPAFLDKSNLNINIGGSVINFIWMIPIYKIESDFIDNNGVSLWESLLEANFHELKNAKRAPIVC